MTEAQRLLKTATKKWAADPCPMPFSGRSVFDDGADWMARELQKIKPEQPILQSAHRDFRFFGLLKYGLAGAAFWASAYFLGQFSRWFSPFAIAVFYAVEVHFLFLFPILLDQKTRRPLAASIILTHRTGFFRCFFGVLQIAAFMLRGLFDSKNRLKNWYIGCLAVLLFYDENRHRLRPKN